MADISPHPALFLLELDSIARGIRTADAMAKRAEIAVLRIGTVHPGKLLILAAGPVGEVEEAREAGLESAGASFLDEVFLPAVHPYVVKKLGGAAQLPARNSLGILETRTVPAVLDFADAALKGADVRLLKLGLADGLGGKGYALLAGSVHDVEAAMELGLERLAPGGISRGGRGREEQIVAKVIISQLDATVAAELAKPGPFFQSLSGGKG